MSANAQHRPLIGLTLGDPAGIGPEIVAQCLSDTALQEQARLVVYGAGGPLHVAAETLGVRANWFRACADEYAHKPILDTPVVLDDASHGDLLDLRREPQRRTGAASKHWVELAIRDALRPNGDPRKLDAIVTAPISKEAWSLAGFKWPGHTELLAHRAKARQVSMVFDSPHLRVALATVHVPLMGVRNILTIGRVFDAITRGIEACQLLGIAWPRIAVCGLNPHAGEGGVLGWEEEKVIAPAIDMARCDDAVVSGPFPADTLFRRAAGGEFDLVVAMYHDQGLIPLKLLGQGSAVNWSVGLPFIRTSPDHGTAFDIAGRGQADASSMRSAIELAVRLATTVPSREVEIQESEGLELGE
ncbi:MAG: 4-hydroxythreonine-4-phosphate dehydrogenase PdxA [Planctomycetes bacterium]|jgi:4-hydroxythreonine-4-phosphate dehydrogenase|nr:4-hydroxythreonine-4-phosphate dehydrogenase PdxA [Planctomycetota bacterium]MCP4838515.1 4-hydroxythreonine-4-phosphate dehydrogenase PdxA [Planctomycetota bacterium]